MTDLTTVLPSFSTQPYVRLLRSLESNNVTTADLISQDCAEIAKRAQLPLPEVKRLSADVLDALQTALGLNITGDTAKLSGSLRKSGSDVLKSWDTISTLDDQLDQALGGGIPVGYITEVVGESGAGKTQFLLTLLLSVQLPRPRGLSCGALYISTESALHTKRLSQLLRTHSNILSDGAKPTLDSVMSIVTPDLESQDHILRYQVPVAIRQYGVRLIILDSVAANYRAEFERPGAGAAAGQTSGANMAQRSSELVKLGQWLRDLAREHSVAIVVANQVGDRFSSGGVQYDSRASRTGNGMQPNIKVTPQVNNGVAENPGLQCPPPFAASTHDPMALDHQQRWFTGWGDDRHPSHSWKSLKTPSLGLIWTTQIACRIALIKRPVYGLGVVAEEDSERGEPVLRKWRRWMRVVFAPHAGPAGPGLERAVEFEIRGDGIRSVRGKTKDGGRGDGEGEGDREDVEEGAFHDSHEVAGR